MYIDNINHNLNIALGLSVGAASIGIFASIFNGCSILRNNQPLFCLVRQQSCWEKILMTSLLPAATFFSGVASVSYIQKIKHEINNIHCNGTIIDQDLSN